MPNYKVSCPKDPAHKEFITSAHEVHDWVVDENGEFKEDLGCDQVAHYPDADNCWTCRVCGEDANVE